MEHYSTPLRICALTMVLALSACGPTLLSREPTGGAIPNGESVLVDDGRCPAGQGQQGDRPVHPHGPKELRLRGETQPGLLSRAVLRRTRAGRMTGQQAADIGR